MKRVVAARPLNCCQICSPTRHQRPRSAPNRFANAASKNGRERQLQSHTMGTRHPAAVRVTTARGSEPGIRVGQLAKLSNGAQGSAPCLQLHMALEHCQVSSLLSAPSLHCQRPIYENPKESDTQNVAQSSKNDMQNY